MLESKTIKPGSSKVTSVRNYPLGPNNEIKQRVLVEGKGIRDRSI